MSIRLYSQEMWGVCKCGHYQWQHRDTVRPDLDIEVPNWFRVDGHGQCGCEDCDCTQFTWIKSVPAKRLLEVKENV